jgi:hypothetical protein
VETPGSGEVKKLVTEGDRSSGLALRRRRGDGGGGGNSTCCNGGNAGNGGNGGAIVLGNPEFSATLETHRDEANGVF